MVGSIVLFLLILVAPIALVYLILGAGHLTSRANYNPNKKYLGTELGDWIGLGKGYLGILLVVILGWGKLFV